MIFSKILFILVSLFYTPSENNGESLTVSYSFEVPDDFQITDRLFAHEENSGSSTYYTVYRFGDMAGYNGKKWFRKWSMKAGASRDFWNAGWWEKDGNKIIVTIYEEFNKREWPPFKFEISGNDLRQYEEGQSYRPDPLKVNRLFKSYPLNGAPSWAQPAMDRMLNRFPPN